MPEWPHAPSHDLGKHGAYMVTAGTYRKQHFFASADRLGILHDHLLLLAPK
jgi:putative transposase